MNKFYSISEIAKHLGVTRQYVWFLIQTGKIKAEKVGKCYIVGEKELWKFLKKTSDDK